MYIEIKLNVYRNITECTYVNKNDQTDISIRALLVTQTDR